MAASTIQIKKGGKTLLISTENPVCATAMMAENIDAEKEYA